MKIVIAFLVVCALLLPVGFSFTGIQEYLEGATDTIQGAIDTIKGIFGNDKFNNEVPQEVDVGKETLELGIGGTENVRSYVEWRIKRDVNILNEENMHVKYVSNILYDIYIRPQGGILKRRYTAIRLTIECTEVYGSATYEADCLWIGVYDFNNETLEAYPMQTKNIGGDVYSTNLYVYSSDNALVPIFDGGDLFNRMGRQYMNKYPKSISSITQTFKDFWDEWTGG